jgi:hypothetical protein
MEKKQWAMRNAAKPTISNVNAWNFISLIFAIEKQS